MVNADGCVGRRGTRPSTSAVHPHSIRPAKGVHITVPADRLPCDIAAVIPVPQDKRSIFVVSWPGTDLVYLGTTDTDYTGPLDDPACTPEDVDYLLEAANNVTTSQLTRADVTGVWAGLRPLLAPPTKGQHVSERTADLSRRHTVRDLGARGRDRDGRQADHLPQDGAGHRRRRGARDLGGVPRRRRCVTKSLRLIGATTGTRDPVAQAQPQATLLGRYGTEAAAVLALADGRPELARAGSRRAPVHRRRAGVRRPRGDGTDARRRAVAGAPVPRSSGGTPACDAAVRSRRARSLPTWAGTTGGGRQAARLRRDLPEGAPDRRTRSAVTTPTPVTPIDAGAAAVTDRLGAAWSTSRRRPRPHRASGATVRHRRRCRAEAGRDWWPLAIGWAADGAVPAAARPWSCGPRTTAQVSAVLAACNEAVVPVTAVGGPQRGVRRVDPACSAGWPWT